MNHDSGRPSARRLRRRFFRRPAEKLARDLLGRVLVRITDAGDRLAGRVVETEAYLGADDKAAHTFNGRRTERNASMYLDGGHLYVYFTYGMHHCMNVVAGGREAGAAVLLRAVEPIDGVDVMRRLRAGKIPEDRLKPTDLCSGPAKCCQAFDIDRDLDGEDLAASDRLWIEPGRAVGDACVKVGPRIGVAYADEWAAKPLRYYVAASPHVSRSR